MLNGTKMKNYFFNPIVSGFFRALNIQGWTIWSSEMVIVSSSEIAIVLIFGVVLVYD